MKTYYCWKCNKDMPFLNESEWLVIEPHLKQGILDIKQFRENSSVDLSTARRVVSSHVMKLFEEITGVSDIHADIISHHRLSNWGLECVNCGQLFRTPKANACAYCEYKKDEEL